jgi:hypothetical protein
MFLLVHSVRWPTDGRKSRHPLNSQGQGCQNLLRKGGESMDMSAVSAAMSFRQAATQQAVGLAVTKLSMDQQKQSGQQVMELLNTASPAGRASPPNLGQNIDISI